MAKRRLRKCAHCAHKHLALKDQPVAEVCTAYQMAHMSDVEIRALPPLDDGVDIVLADTSSSDAETTLATPDTRLGHDEHYEIEVVQSTWSFSVVVELQKWIDVGLAAVVYPRSTPRRPSNSLEARAVFRSAVVSSCLLASSFTSVPQCSPSL